jgi:hypothetical protein
MAKFTHSEIVQLVAEAKALKIQAEAADERAKEAIKARFGDRMTYEWLDSKGDAIVCSSELGTAKISPIAGRETIDKAKVAEILSPKQFAACIKKGESSFQVRFSPAIQLSKAS